MIILKQQKVCIATPFGCGHRYAVEMLERVPGFLYVLGPVFNYITQNGHQVYQLVVSEFTGYVPNMVKLYNYRKLLLVRNLVDRRIAQYLRFSHFKHGYKFPDRKTFEEELVWFNDIRNRAQLPFCLAGSITTQIFPFCPHEIVPSYAFYERMCEIVGRDKIKYVKFGNETPTEPDYFDQILPKVYSLCREHVIKYHQDDIAHGWLDIPSHYEERLRRK